MQLFLRFFVCVLCWISSFEPAYSAFQVSSDVILLRKPLNISLQTHYFLKNCISLQRSLLNAETSEKLGELLGFLAAIQDHILQAEVIAPKDVEAVFAIINKAQKILFYEVLVADNVQRSKTFDVWWQYVLGCIKRVQVRGCEQDVGYLQQCLYDSSMLDHSMIRRLMLICNDILHHFDGVMVTEYDFLVLSNVVVGLMLLAGA